MADPVKRALQPTVRGLIACAGKLEQLFGEWPRFHDAEVLRIVLNREGPTIELVIRSFGPPGRSDTAGNASAGCICTVTFIAQGVDEVELAGFNHQNVLADISFDAVERGGATWLRVGLEGIFGLQGSFQCNRLEVRL